MSSLPLSDKGRQSIFLSGSPLRNPMPLSGPRLSSGNEVSAD